MRAWSRWSTFDPERGTPAGWLIAIVRDRARRRRFTPALPTDVAQPTWMTPADLDLERAIAQLSARQKLAVDLYYFVDLDVNVTGVADMLVTLACARPVTLASAVSIKVAGGGFGAVAKLVN